MAATWTRTITTAADGAGIGSTRAAIRENLVENWLAEADSGFFSDPVLNDGIGWAYRRLGRAMGGVDARWDIDINTTAPYELPVPRDLVYLEKVTYNPAGPTGANQRDLFQVSFDDMFVFYGRQWQDDAAGTPSIVWFRGWRTFGLYPRASAVTNGISFYGRSLPTALAGDTDVALTPAIFDDTIGSGAFVYSLRRLGMQNGRMHPQYQDAVAEWTAGLQEATTHARRTGFAELRVAGTTPTGIRGRIRVPYRLLYDFEA